MTNLTEKWKAEELEKGFYYLKMASGNIVIDQYYNNGKKFLFANYLPQNIEEVLAPVPTYYKFDALKMNCEFIHRCLDGSRKKNTELVKLLKECQDIIEWYKADCGYKDLPTESVLTKIEEMLK